MKRKSHTQSVSDMKIETYCKSMEELLRNINSKCSFKESKVEKEEDEIRLYGEEWAMSP